MDMTDSPDIFCEVLHIVLPHAVHVVYIIEDTQSGRCDSGYHIDTEHCPIRVIVWMVKCVHHLKKQHYLVVKRLRNHLFQSIPTAVLACCVRQSGPISAEDDYMRNLILPCQVDYVRYAWKEILMVLVAIDPHLHARRRETEQLESRIARHLEVCRRHHLQTGIAELLDRLIKRCRLELLIECRQI